MCTCRHIIESFHWSCWRRTSEIERKNVIWLATLRAAGALLAHQYVGKGEERASAREKFPRRRCCSEKFDVIAAVVASSLVACTSVSFFFSFAWFIYSIHSPFCFYWVRNVPEREREDVVRLKIKTELENEISMCNRKEKEASLATLAKPLEVLFLAWDFQFFSPLLFLLHAQLRQIGLDMET